MVVFIFGIILILTFSFLNGSKDGINAVATVIASRSLKPRTAVVVAAVVELIAPLAGYLTYFAGSGTVQAILNTGESYFAARGTVIVISAMVSVIAWNTVIIRLKLPSSSTHSMVGALCGAAVAMGGFGAVNWQTLMLSVVLFMFLTPLIGFAAGFVFMKTADFLTRKSHVRVNKVFMRAQFFSLMFLSFNHSLNDSQKSIGLMLLLYGAFLGSISAVPVWMVLSAGAALCAGIVFSGNGILKTVGSGIYRLRPKHAFSAQMASSAVIFASSLLGAPVSSGQIVVSSISGVGASQNINAVRWFAVKNIALSWLFTLPASALISAGVCLLAGLIF